MKNEKKIKNEKNILNVDAKKIKAVHVFDGNEGCYIEMEKNKNIIDFLINEIKKPTFEPCYVGLKVPTIQINRTGTMFFILKSMYEKYIRIEKYKKIYMF